MEIVENLQKLKRKLSRADFEQKFPHPWLVRELDEDERPSLFRTMVSMRAATSEPPPPPRRAAAGIGAQLAGDPGRFGAYPLAKSGSNPWSDRILVGRASNNDIVLRNDRISKLHAWFQLGPRGQWRLHDARSANGTRVDGEPVPPGEEGVEVQPRQTIAFGTVETLLLASGDLYDRL